MEDSERIKRFDVPTIEQLKPLLGGDVTEGTLRTIIAILDETAEPEDMSPATAAWVSKCYHEPAWHERALNAISNLLECFDVASMEINEDTYTDAGVRMCPAFSYANMGDPYIVTLARDHKAGQWVVACWGDLLEEYEQEEECGDHEKFEEEPSSCPNCAKKAFELKSFAPPDKPEEKSYSWVCKACNHHCFAVDGYEPPEPDEDEDTE